MPAHLRNINALHPNPAGGFMKWLGPQWCGVLASDVPSSGDGGRPGLLYPDVVLNGWSTQHVRIWIEVSNFASLFVGSNSHWVASNLVDGTYGATGRVYLDEVDQGTKSLTLTVGGGIVNVAISGLVQGNVRAGAAVTIELVGLLATITAGVTGSVRASAAVQIAPPPEEVTATITAAVAGQVRASAAIAIFDPGQVLPTLTEGRRRVKGGTSSPVRLAPMDVAEVDDVAFVFDPKVFDFEPLLSVSVIVEPRVGVDGAPQPLNVGAYQVFGHTVIQRMSGARGVPGVTYLIRVEATNVKGRRQLATAFMKVLRLL